MLIRSIVAKREERRCEIRDGANAPAIACSKETLNAEYICSTLSFLLA